MEIEIGSISLRDNGKSFSIQGIVERVVQTGGPTLFTISDGTGSIVVKGFDGPGVRAYPHINEEDAVTATIKVNEYNDELEGETKRLNKLEAKDKKKLLETIEATHKKRAAPTVVDFLVKSPILDKLKDSFIEAATQIRLAIMKGRPIIVRHHNDCDGYSSGYSLERAILPLVQKQHNTAKATWEHYSRSPCAAPFYEIEDSIKDTARSLSNAAKFSEKMPLILIVDNGSSSEDLLAIKQGKIHGADFIVVDHHFFDKDVISSEVLVHINPFLVGEDGSMFSAGMLCTELARQINLVDRIDHIPAMAGLADRINNPEVMNAYLAIAEKKGYSKELLLEIGGLLDFVSSKLRFMEAREYVEVVFGEDIERQKKLVALMAPYIRNLEATGVAIARSAAKREVHGKTTLQLLYIEETFSRGAYPKPGRCTGLLHDLTQEKDGITNLVSVGVLSDAMTMRATAESGFSVHELLAYLREKLPEAFAEGGGHKHAGAIKFVPSQQKKILDALRVFLEKKN